VRRGCRWDAASRPPLRSGHWTARTHCLPWPQPSSQRSVEFLVAKAVLGSRKLAYGKSPVPMSLGGKNGGFCECERLGDGGREGRGAGGDVCVSCTSSSAVFCRNLCLPNSVFFSRGPAIDANPLGPEWRFDGRAQSYSKFSNDWTFWSLGREGHRRRRATPALQCSRRQAGVLGRA
jgi:hypothetical protein